MNWNQAVGDWKEYEDGIKARCGNVADDELSDTVGKRDHLVGKLQSDYQYGIDEAHKGIVDFPKALPQNVENHCEKYTTAS